MVTGSSATMSSRQSRLGWPNHGGLERKEHAADGAMVDRS